MEIKVTVRQSLFFLELRQLFYGHLAIQSMKFAKLFKKTEKWVNQWSKESPSRTKQGVSGRPFVLTNYARNVIKKAKYERNNLTRKIAKRPQHHNINASS